MLNIRALFRSPAGESGVICSIRQEKVTLEGYGETDRWVIRIQNNNTQHWFELSFDPVEFMEWCDNLMGQCIRDKIGEHKDKGDNIIGFNSWPMHHPHGG
jgi:hypothetical protein